MTTDEAKQALKEGTVVIYKETEWYIDHILTCFENGFKNALFLIPRNGINSATVARMKDCELKKK